MKNKCFFDKWETIPPIKKNILREENQNKNAPFKIL